MSNGKFEGSGEEVVRVRMPDEGEMFGVVTEMSGSGRMRANCQDGKERMIRIPGKLRKRVWTRPGDIIILKPWEIEGEKKADLIWRYTKPQIGWLEKNGYLKELV